jgi:cytochrome c peroxidase
MKILILIEPTRKSSGVIRALSPILFALVSLASQDAACDTVLASTSEPLWYLGRMLFRTTAMSKDGHTSCQTCHDPKQAFSDGLTVSRGTGTIRGTRNAPSLVGVAQNSAFFWDGRRTLLEDAVLDPITNPAELGMSSTRAALAAVEQDRPLSAQFRHTFQGVSGGPTLDQVSRALSSYVRSLRTGTSAYDRYRRSATPLAAEAEQGRALFEGVGKCSECHITGKTSPFTDGKYHHSGVAQEAIASKLPELTRMVIDQNLEGKELGQRLLTDPDWSALGRFVVDHRPSEIGAFRTPSLRNVAVTAPYMHDGSIPSLEKAVDQEIYYRGLSSGHPLDLSLTERHAIVAFLESITDFAYVDAINSD